MLYRLDHAPCARCETTDAIAFDHPQDRLCSACLHRLLDNLHPDHYPTLEDRPMGPIDPNPLNTTPDSCGDICRDDVDPHPARSIDELLALDALWEEERCVRLDTHRTVRTELCAHVKHVHLSNLTPIQLHLLDVAALRAPEPPHAVVDAAMIGDPDSYDDWNREATFDPCSYGHRRHFNPHRDDIVGYVICGPYIVCLFL